MRSIFRTYADAQRRRLDALKKKGKPAFVFKVGVLWWGLPFTIAMIFTTVFVWPWIDGEPLSSAAAITGKILIWSLLGIIGGVAFGLYNWSIMSRADRDSKFETRSKGDGETDPGGR